MSCCYRTSPGPPSSSAALSGVKNYSSRHAASLKAAVLRRGPGLLGSAELSGGLPTARRVGTRAMEETPPPPLGCNKPHLEKLTLGITRILGEWGRWEIVYRRGHVQ